MRCPWPSVPSAFAVLRPSSNFVVVLQFSGTFNRDGPEHTDTPTHRHSHTQTNTDHVPRASQYSWYPQHTPRAHGASQQVSVEEAGACHEVHSFE